MTVTAVAAPVGPRRALTAGFSISQVVAELARIASGTGVRVYRRSMGTSEQDLTGSWASESCTLPTVQRPLRMAEFDQLFEGSLRGVERAGPGRVRLELEPTAEVAARVADLVARETECCSFFTFSLTATAGALDLEVSVPIGQFDVLDALAARAGAAAERHA